MKIGMRLVMMRGVLSAVILGVFLGSTGINECLAAEKAGKKKTYTIGLSMYSLRQLFFSGELTAMDYPKFARETFGIRHIDVWDGGFPKDRKNDPEFYRELKSHADKAGCKIFLVMAGAIDASGSDSATRLAQAEKFFPQVDYAKILGAQFVRLFLRAPNGDRVESLKACMETLKPLADYAQKKGIRIVIEPGASDWSKKGTYLADLAGELNHPSLRLMPDFGKMKNDDPYGGTVAMMPFSDCVSAKSHNFDDSGYEVDFDYPRLMKSIHDAGFTGIVAIEYEGQKLGPVEGVRATQKLLKKLQ